MYGSELLVPYLVAERLRQAERHRLERLATRSQRGKGESDAVAGIATEDEHYLPVLRGYPVDPFYANAGPVFPGLSRRLGFGSK
jgi:hypothetical protein